MSTRYAAGIATAYGSAVRGGYEGTYEQFCAALGDLANVLEDFENFSVSVNTLPEGSSATASYADGVLTVGIPKGDTGNGIASAVLNSNYTLTLTFTDGTSYITPSIRGAQGATGATGAPGETGATGNGIASIAKTGTSGLVDTYTITYTDGNTFDFEVTNGQDGEVTEAELEQTLDTFAEGVHEDLTSGNAEQLLSDNYTENTQPYLFRQTGGNSDREYLVKIVGGTLNWNQLVGLEASNYDNLSNVSFSASNQNISLTVTSASSTLKAAKITTLIEGHKYFFSGEVISHSEDYNGYFGFFASSNASISSISYAAPSEGKIYALQSGDWFGMRIANASPKGTVGEYKKVQLIDLTAMFGTTIADYVYGLEQATEGAGIAWLKKYIDLDTYHAYSAPTLKHVEGLTSHITKDADNNVIGSYVLDSDVVLRGIPRLVDGKLKYDGDEYLPSGVINRRYELMRLTSFSGKTSYENPYGNAFYKSMPVNKTAYTICNNFIYASDGVGNMPLGSYGGNSGAAKTWLFILPSTITTIEEANAWLESNPTYIIYPLDTPTTESADPYRQLQICDPNGTEQFVTASDIPVGTETRYPENLRAKIEGLPWNLSMIAPIEDGATASQAYTTGQYFLHNNVFCKAKTNIASGATFTLNTNYEEIDLATELYSALH